MTAPILGRVVSIVQDELRRTRFPFAVPPVSAESELVRDLRCCAIDYQCLAMEVDEQFGIAIPDRFVEEGSPDLWRSVSDIARTVESLLTVSTGA
jgi:acyl carrier protein